ncbi:MAG: hypothetical protein L0220_32615 [Acidobacteria bacterium]|nr:hypothetical protein [Acidobacteriota bacterium]
MKASSPQPQKLAAQVSSGASSRRASWKIGIESRDNHSLWRALNRLVAIHPLVRTALDHRRSFNQTVPLLTLNDLTQDLYLRLLQNGRFNHYISSEMSDAEIEREIYQIELPNMLIGGLRRHRPENYRMVRRVGSVLGNQSQFRRFNRRLGEDARHRQAASAIYGLREWTDDKPVKDNGTFNDLIDGIPVRKRNRRRSGWTGDVQVIVTNIELVELMVEIFQAIDSPAPLRILRQLALSKLPLFDPVLIPIDDEVDEERERQNFYDFFASSEESPEEKLLRIEQEEHARFAAHTFLNQLSLLVRSNAARTERIWRILWHCYFDPSGPSQLEIAEKLGISDSSVSDYRRKLEMELQKLNFSPEHIRSFTEELAEQLHMRLSFKKNLA